MSIRPAAPYDVLADVYDRLMSHVDYVMWAAHVRALWERHGRGRLAGAYDAACGTGRLLAALAAPGLRLAGSDGSAAMLARARARLPRRVRLTCQDLREVADGERWDLVTCLYDSLNYLLEEDELREALVRLAALARPGGLVVFDMCTERNSLVHFSDRVEQGRAGDWSWERHSWYERESRLHHNEFLIEDPRGGRWAETHRQRVYPVQAAMDTARAAGLDILACYADFTLAPGGEHADRVHVAARRPGAAA